MQEALFEGHALKPIHDYPVFRNGEGLIWPSVLLLLLFGSLVVVRVGMRDKLNKILLSTISLQATRQIEREQFNPLRPFSLLLFLMFCAQISFFAYHFNKNFGDVFDTQKPFLQFFFFLIIVISAITLKYVFNYLLGQLTEMPALFNEYSYNNLLINQATGIVLFPFLVAVELSSIQVSFILLPCLLVLGVNVLLKWFRGFLFSAIELRIGFLQIFIYFCAVEILPALVLVKFIIVNF
jgi:hypothetical protein